MSNGEPHASATGPQPHDVDLDALARLAARHGVRVWQAGDDGVLAPMDTTEPPR